MSRLDPSRLSDQPDAAAASSEDQAEVSLDDAKRSAMVGQTIKAKIIQVGGLWRMKFGHHLPNPKHCQIVSCAGHQVAIRHGHSNLPSICA